MRQSESMPRRCTLLAGLMLLLSTVAVAVQADDGNGWIAEFVWSPHYCSKTLETREEQCRRPNGFVLQTLTRVIDGRIVEPCQEGPELSAAMVDQLSRVTRNRAETRLGWQRQGRCSGMSATDYASYAEYVDRRMAWPSDYQTGGPGVIATPDEIVAAIGSENPALTAENLVLHCQRRQLKAVSLCLDARFEPSATDCPLRSNCGREVMVRPGKPMPDHDSR